MKIGTLETILAGPAVRVNDSQLSEWVLEWHGSFPELAEALEGVGKLSEPLRYHDLKRNGVYPGPGYSGSSSPKTRKSPSFLAQSSKYRMSSSFSEIRRIPRISSRCFSDSPL